MTFIYLKTRKIEWNKSFVKRELYDCEKYESKYLMHFILYLLNIIPKNPFAALSEGNMLQIIVMYILIGFALTAL